MKPIKKIIATKWGSLIEINDNVKFYKSESGEGYDFIHTIVKSKIKPELDIKEFIKSKEYSIIDVEIETEENTYKNTLKEDELIDYVIRYEILPEYKYDEKYKFYTFEDFEKDVVSNPRNLNLRKVFKEVCVKYYTYLKLIGPDSYVKSKNELEEFGVNTELVINDSRRLVDDNIKQTNFIVEKLKEKGFDPEKWLLKQKLIQFEDLKISISNFYNNSNLE